jgi:hypothetical protein
MRASPKAAQEKRQPPESDRIVATRFWAARIRLCVTVTSSSNSSSSRLCTASSSSIDVAICCNQQSQSTDSSVKTFAVKSMMFRIDTISFRAVCHTSAPDAVQATVEICMKPTCTNAALVCKKVTGNCCLGPPRIKLWQYSAMTTVASLIEFPFSERAACQSPIGLQVLAVADITMPEEAT